MEATPPFALKPLVKVMPEAVMLALFVTELSGPVPLPLMVRAAPPGPTRFTSELITKGLLSRTVAMLVSKLMVAPGLALLTVARRLLGPLSVPLVTVTGPFVTPPAKKPKSTPRVSPPEFVARDRRGEDAARRA